MSFAKGSIYNIFQQKIAFEDRRLAVARRMPFSIDLDEQHIDWPDDDRAILLEDPEFEWLSGIMPGAIHCRPEGRVDGNWIKLGWAYNPGLSHALARILQNELEKSNNTL